MRPPGSVKSATAFRTISEVATDLGVPQHVLRFWEGKFPQIRPLKRGGGRRYYRPEDVDLLRRIQSLLHSEGYTIKGVQRLLLDGTPEMAATPAVPANDTPPAALPEAPLPEAALLPDPEPVALPAAGPSMPEPVRRELELVLDELRSLRDLLRSAPADGRFSSR